MTENQPAQVVDLDAWRDGYRQGIGFVSPPEGWIVASVHPKDCPANALIRVQRGQWQPISHIVTRTGTWRVWVDHGDHLTHIDVEPSKRRDSTFLTVAYKPVASVPTQTEHRSAMPTAMRWHPSLTPADT